MSDDFMNLSYEFEFDDEAVKDVYQFCADTSDNFVFGLNTYKGGNQIYINPETNEINYIGSGGSGGTTYIGGRGIDIDQDTHVISVTGQFVPGGGALDQVLTKTGSGDTDFGWKALPVWDGTII